MKKSTTSWRVSGAGMISRSCRYLGGLKKWVPQKCALKSSLRPSTSIAMGMPLVLEVMYVPGRRCCSTFSKSCCLMSNRSTTTSKIQSHWAILERSSSKLPVSMRAANRLL